MEEAPSSPVNLVTDAGLQIYQDHAEAVDRIISHSLNLAQEAEPLLAHAAVAGAMAAVVRHFIEKTGTVVQVVSEREVIAGLVPLIAKYSEQVLEKRRPPTPPPAEPPKERKLHKLKGGNSRG